MADEKLEIRKYDRDEIAKFKDVLASCWWEGRPREERQITKLGVSTRFNELSQLNQELIQLALVEIGQNREEMTTERIPILWPQLRAANKPSPQLMSALKIFLFSEPMEYIYATSGFDPRCPEHLVKFVQYWKPMLKYLARYCILKHPYSDDGDLPEKARDIILEREANCRNFVIFDHDQSTKIEEAKETEFAEDINSILVHAIFDWAREVHKFTLKECYTLKQRGLLKELKKHKPDLFVDPQTARDRLYDEGNYWLSYVVGGLIGKQGDRKHHRTYPSLLPDGFNHTGKLIHFNREETELYIGKTNMRWPPKFIFFIAALVESKPLGVKPTMRFSNDGPMARSIYTMLKQRLPLDLLKLLVKRSKDFYLGDGVKVVRGTDFLKHFDENLYDNSERNVPYNHIDDERWKK